jgi:hypothetical protein
MARKTNLRPSRKFIQLVELHGGAYKASRAWKVEYKSISRFLRSGGGLTGDTIAAIVDRSGLSFEDLFSARG